MSKSKESFGKLTKIQLFQKLDLYDKIIADLRILNQGLEEKLREAQHKITVHENFESTLRSTPGLPYNQLFEVLKENLRYIVEGENFGSNDGENTAMQSRQIHILAELLHGVAKCKENKEYILLLKFREDDYEVD